MEAKKLHLEKILINYKWMEKYKQTTTCNNFIIWTWTKQVTRNKEHKYLIINSNRGFWIAVLIHKLLKASLLHLHQEWNKEHN
jgi:hypothetical protein